MESKDAGKRRDMEEHQTGENEDRSKPIVEKSQVNWGELSKEVQHELANSGREPYFSIAPDKHAKTSLDRASLDDAVQEAVTEIIECWEEYAIQSLTLGNLKEELCTVARRHWRNTVRKERRRRGYIRAHSLILSTEDLFEVICKRDEVAIMVREMFERVENDPEGKGLLDAVLNEGIPFESTKELAEFLKFTRQHTTNVKRRIIPLACRVMREIVGPVNGVE